MEYTEKYLKSIFWIFGVWDDYLNDDMKNDLRELVDKIYDDWSKEKKVRKPYTKEEIEEAEDELYDYLNHYWWA